MLSTPLKIVDKRGSKAKLANFLTFFYSFDMKSLPLKCVKAIFQLSKKWPTFEVTALFLQFHS